LVLVGRNSGGEQRTASSHAAGHIGQQQSVGAGATAQLQYLVVASDLSFQRELSADPPNAGVEKQRGLDQVLTQVHPVIPPSHMRQFMLEDLFHAA
jgi:hypothetical protein